MEYKEDRKFLKEWAVKMDDNGKLVRYGELHHVLVNLKKVK